MSLNAKFTSVSLCVHVKNGVASTVFPEVLRQNLLNTCCIINSVQSFTNFNQSYYIFGNFSFFREKDQFLKENLLQSFQSQSAIFHFPLALENMLTVLPHNLTLYVKEYTENGFEVAKTFSGNICLVLSGYRTINSAD